ncbi:uncharacterized protein VP01_8335g1 [Puccinia sorghi]|uniref:Uncharacterized protein n=1 Tax=Puccinia sorghi TaxID=27349 RepID=A0A0L6U9L7_9BASI|nr:uncharacterized protein VP01_8335g1 [Puccinia sorghi]
MQYSENGWFWVQYEFAKETDNNLSIYSMLLGGETAVKNIISQLKVSRINIKIPLLKWLSKKYHRQEIANTFQRPVVLLFAEESLSFITTTTPIKDKNSKLDPFYLMYLNKNHWVLVLLKATDKSEPTPPVIGLKKLSSQFTHSWRSEIKDYFSLYNQHLQPIKKI